MDEQLDLTRGAVTRRGFLSAAGALGVLASLEKITPAYARTPRSLPLPGAPVHAASGELAGRGNVDLRIARTAIRVGDRRAAATAINGTVPGPLLRFREGEEAIIQVTNELAESTSIHWHGVIVPNPMDGVPGVVFPGIPAGSRFTYRFPLRQHGTYWYHSHSGLQEQIGHFGPLIIDPAEPEPFQYDREYVVMLSDWPWDDPYEILDRLKKKSDYYNFQRRTLGDFFRDAKRQGLGATVRDRLMWGKMRMSPVDISDVTGAVYSYLINGRPPESNWTGLFRPGERVRLRFINAGAGTYFDVRIPGLEMMVVAVSGQWIQPMMTDEFRIEIAQTYDVIVQPPSDIAYTIFAESLDRSGYASGTLAPRMGMQASIPARRPRQVLTMADMGMPMNMPGMGMGGMDMGAPDFPRATPAQSGAGPGMKMPGINMPGTQGPVAKPGADSTAARTGGNAMPGMKMPSAPADSSHSAAGSSAQTMPGMVMPPGNAPGGAATAGMAEQKPLPPRTGGQRLADGSVVYKHMLHAPGAAAPAVEHGADHHGPGNAGTPMVTRSRLGEPGPGLGRDGWRVLVYTDLRALEPRPNALQPPDREIEIHLTGNMDRYMWSMNGIKFSDVHEPIQVGRGERVRVTLVNDTMMSHPMHIHGMWMELENGAGAHIPRVHTVDVKPADRLSFLATPGEDGPWAFHCHVLNHMVLGMFRVIQVGPATQNVTAEQ